jgi:signal transduction histidine kinase
MTAAHRRAIVLVGTSALENTKRQWESAADALPQLICLLDEGGKIIRGNRTLERWGLTPVTLVRGMTLHDVLHGAQCDGRCEIGALWREARESLLRGQPVKREIWDARLGRHVSITLQPQQQPGNGVVTIAAIEDIGELQAERRRLSAQRATVREDERRRVARDLHDALGQSLNVLKLSIQETARRMETEQSGSPAQSLYQLARDVQGIMGEVRRIAMDLRPSTLDDLGLIPTLSWFFREVEAGCKALKIERAIEVTDADVPEPLKIEIYRILQEGVCNTLRHAVARVVRVRLHRDAEGLHLCIQDDGRGFTGEVRRGVGLLNMKERAENAGGRLVIESARGKGTRLTASWPEYAAPSAPESAPEPRRRGPRLGKESLAWQIVL